MEQLLKIFIPLIVMLAIFAVFAGLIKILMFRLGKKKPSKESKETYPYIKNGQLFTPAERSFLGVLDQAIGDDHRIFGKVRLGDLLQVEKGLDRSSNQAALNRIQSKHIDFVVCRSGDLAPVLLCELDDKSHARADRTKRDQFVDAALQKAGLPLIRVPAKKNYSLQELKTLLTDQLQTAPQVGS